MLTIFFSFFFLLSCLLFFFFFFFFNDTATTEIYTLSLHDALPIFLILDGSSHSDLAKMTTALRVGGFNSPGAPANRSEEHTSELQSLAYLVCRLLLEKKKKQSITRNITIDNI